MRYRKSWTWRSRLALGLLAPGLLALVPAARGHSAPMPEWTEPAARQEGTPFSATAGDRSAVARPAPSTQVSTAVSASDGAVATQPPPTPLIPVPADPPGVAPLPSPTIKAEAAIVVDARTGTILFEKNARLRRPMASTTKIMTATLVLESNRLDDWVVVSDYARKTPYANLNAKPGERIRVRELLYAIMMRSSNDGCVAVSQHLDGEPWRFAYRMTSRAREIGALDTNFVTTNGLFDPRHYSTAADLAQMTRHAIQYPLFNEIVATRTHTLERSINKADILVRNHNKFLAKYPGADGVKTGYVKEAGRCLVASATKMDGGVPWRLITVVLNSGDTYGDSSLLQDWARKYFQPISFTAANHPVGEAVVAGGAPNSVALQPTVDLCAVTRRVDSPIVTWEIALNAPLRAPLLPDAHVGTLIGKVNGTPVAWAPLAPCAPVSQLWTASISPWGGWSALLIGIVILGPRYARTLAKGALRRRRRFATRRGGLDHPGPGCGERAGGPRPGL